MIIRNLKNFLKNLARRRSTRQKGGKLFVETILVQFLKLIFNNPVSLFIYFKKPTSSVLLSAFARSVSDLL
jgi:hypothetical protein